MSSEQKDIGVRLILFVGALVTMILLAGFAFSTGDNQPKISTKEEISKIETN